MARPDRSRADSADDPIAAIRQMIIRLGEQRQQAAAEAGRALVTHAEVERAVRGQRAYLTRVTREIDSAIRLAAEAAERAHAEARSAPPGVPDEDADAAERRADGAAAPYELTCAGLRRQRDVVAAAADELEHLDVISKEQITRTRELLRASVRSLDDALREQLHLLVGLERAERARLVAIARSRLTSGS